MGEIGEVKLLDCPFCGGEAHIRNVTDDAWDVNEWAIDCWDCYSSSSQWKKKEQAIKAWNTRTAPNVGEITKALELCISTLGDERIGKWDYMEGSQIYKDFANAKEVAEQAISNAIGGEG